MERKPPTHAVWMGSAGLGLMAAVPPLAWTDSLVAEYSLPKLCVMSLGALVAGLGALAAAAAGAPIARPTPLDSALAAAFGALALSFLFSQDRYYSFWGRYNSYTYGLLPLLLLGVVYLFSAWACGRAQLGVLRLSLAVAAVAGGYALAQAFGLEVFARVAKLPTGRGLSTLGSPVHLGAYLATMLPLSLHWAVGRGKERAFGVVALGLVSGGLWASVSRGSWIAAAVGCAGYWAFGHGFSLPRWDARRWALAGGLAAALGAAFVVHLLRRPAPFMDSGRIEIYRIGWRIFQEHPIFGIGPDNFEQGFRAHLTDAYMKANNTLEFQQHAHNDILQSLSTTGLIGAAAYGFFLYRVAASAWDSPLWRSDRALAAALSLGLLALFVNMKFNPVPLEVFAAAALFAGVLCPAVSSAYGRASGLAESAALAALGLFTAVSSLRLAASDREIKRGLVYERRLPEEALAHFDRGVALAPCELEHRMRLVNHLISRADGAQPADKTALLDLAVDNGAEAVRCHPGHLEAHYVYGAAALMSAQAGRPERLALAQAELDEAVRSAPTFEPLLRARLRAAVLGDENELVESLSQRLDEMRRLKK